MSFKGIPKDIMLTGLIKRLFGSRNERVLRRIQKIVNAVNALEPSIHALSDDELRAKTTEFKERVAKGESLDAILPEAFAVVREASVRTLGMRHFDVQIVGGVVLHEGSIAEMRTGEGKTLSGTLPVYLNALTDRGVHVITVNDYLAKRDSEWMAPIYEFLGLTVGVILTGQSNEEKREAYGCDVIYGTNNEFGFDYLRDNMAFSLEEKVQRDLHYAIVDEVDSILIDEARTPLIISGPSEGQTELCQKIDAIVPQLTEQLEEEGPGDFTKDEKTRQAYLTEAGHQRVEEMLTDASILHGGESLYDPANINVVHHLNAALRAHSLYFKDIDYIVANGEVVIVDEHTGRTMPGRRWSDGLHQAIEAKEQLKINPENQTLASITFQNYFRLYDKLAGMTGTADTEAYEFQQIYNLEVVVIPTNKPMIRDDQADLVYLNQKDKFDAVIVDIKDCVTRRQPVLVGTASIEASEQLSKLLKAQKIDHQVLNAKYHEQEASVIAQAGRPGAVTIATNMAGRGTDIVLGGNLEAEIAEKREGLTPQAEKSLRDAWKKRHEAVLNAGGLRIIGSERHESRRIDNQLRGRAGRQGDPGQSRFYLSLDDNLMRIFASDKVAGIMQRLGMQAGEAIEHPLITRAIINAQRKVEGHNFDIRKQLLEYDDVANDQRKVIYRMRNDLMEQDDVSQTIQAMNQDYIQTFISGYLPPESMAELWDIPALEAQLKEDFGLEVDLVNWLDTDDTVDEQAIRARIKEAYEKAYKKRDDDLGNELMRHFEKAVLLQTVDLQWREHLSAMDYLRQGIHLRGYAQKDPKQEFKRESFALFTTLLEHIKHDTMSLLLTAEIHAASDVDAVDAERQALGEQALHYQHAPLSEMGDLEEPEPLEGENIVPFVREVEKVGRNEPCPCGSGKKFKVCHGRIA